MSETLWCGKLGSTLTIEVLSTVAVEMKNVPLNNMWCAIVFHCIWYVGHFVQFWSKVAVASGIVWPNPPLGEDQPMGWGFRDHSSEYTDIFKNLSHSKT